MLNLIDIFRGRLAPNEKLAAAIASDPCLADAMAMGAALGSAPDVNWEALAQLILEILPLVLPLLV